MSDTNGALAPTSPVVDQIVAAIPEDVSQNHRALLEPFIRMVLRRIADVDVADRTHEDVYAEMADFLSFVSSRPEGEDMIRVFTPEVEVSSGQAAHSIVQVVTDDRPFLVDSLTIAVSKGGAQIVRHLHPVMGVERDGDGTLTGLAAARRAEKRESAQLFELNRSLSNDECEVMVSAIRRVLSDLAKVVADFPAFREAVEGLVSSAKRGAHHYAFEEISETVAFLEWLLDNNFVFLGYRRYDIVDADGGSVVPDVDSGLGVMRDPVHEPKTRQIASLPDHLRERYTGGDLIVITKTNRTATIHRKVRMDYVGLREVDENGKMVAELRLLGLFTSKAYLSPAAETPVLRLKLERILDAQDVIEGSHDFKAIVALFDTFPKDELLAMGVEAIAESIAELLESEEADSVRLIVRRDLLNRYFSVLVSVSRDRFNATLRMDLQQLFMSTLGGTAIDYRLALAESGHARIHFTVWIEEGSVVRFDLAELEKRVVALSRNWHDRVKEELEGRVDDAEATRLADTWTIHFPNYYRIATGVDIAAGDVINVDRLAASDADVIVGLQNETATDNPPGVLEPLTRITVYRSSGKLNLSEMMPHIDNLGLKVVEEIPTRLRGDSDVFIHDFGVLTLNDERIDLAGAGERIAKAVEAALAGETESDSLHRLVVSTGLDHQEIAILRAYRGYWRLVTPSFSIGYMDNALTGHPKIAEDLVRLFEARLSQNHDEKTERTTTDRILVALEAVTSLDEDRILRGFLGLVQATVRSNIDVAGRQSLSFKFRSADVPDMPEPKPLFEIFVYARDFEGVHLRGDMIARGGLRWSDRMEDYRTEVLGLMKAQMTKNAVIVPTGAKGGFVIKQPAEAGRPTYEEVKDGYEKFMRGLLDVTDNLVSGSVVPPAGVVRHDGDDPYFVVAADKGTASFSDTANRIAGEYEFWLDDAFASGGSAGYDHKALGITARGAWESVRRHFHDLNVNADTDEITAVGIGDMSGDVFGNGMLISKHLKLVAAFDHRHVFIDPDPDAAVSWDERKRVSELGRSSWEDYDNELISEGGGVFSRRAKRIELSPQMRSVLDTEVEKATPSELIQLILKAPVDLLWNGGIGTYVKARSESHDLVQDRSNDSVRVNGRDLRCRVIGEGGNLGCTQLGRIEFGRRGGRVFADFIDNSGGVHASDREVNLKILLGIAEANGTIDREERDRIIQSVSEDIVQFILYDNFLQAQILSQEYMSSHRKTEAYIDLMDRLEREGLLARDIEFLPTNEEMAQRVREGKPMARPELAVLLAYAKRSLAGHILKSTLPDEPHFEQVLFEYFPKAITERFPDEIRAHPLRRELIATILSNQVVDSQGSTFYSRMRTVTGASAADIVRAYRVARIVTGADGRWDDIEAIGASIEPKVANRLMQDVDDLVSWVSRWYLARPNGKSIDDEITGAVDAFASLSDGFPAMPLPEWHQPYLAVVDELESMGVNHEIAVRHAYQRALRRGPDVVDLADRFGRDVLHIAALYSAASQRFRIGWIERLVMQLPGATAFDRLAIEGVRDDLQALRRGVVFRILDETDGSIDAYVEANPRVVPRTTRWFEWLARDGIEDVSSGVVATRRLQQILLG